MRYSQNRWMSGLRVLLSVVLLAVAAASLGPTSALAQGASAPSAAAADATASLGAHWVQKKVFFIYQGLQTDYNCEGLTDQMRKVVLQLGARRSDLDLRQTGCSFGFNHPTVSSGVAGTISVLEPADTASANATPVNAHWQPVQLKLDLPGRDQNGQCELLQQVKSRLLPLFATRNVQFDSAGCSPRTLLVGRTILTLEVLVPDHRSDLARE